MNGAIIGNSFPKFKNTYHTVESTEGVRRLLLVNTSNRTVKYVHDEHLETSIFQYCNKEIPSISYKVTSTHCREIAKMWKQSVKPIEEPKGIAELSDPGLSFHRIPFDAIDDGDDSAMAVWSEVLGRCSNSLAFTCFIGSLFFKEADRQQYLWLYGEGQNGKGRISQFLRRLMGPSYSVEYPDVANGKHWTNGLLGKRLVVFPDTNNRKFVKTGRFKSLSGDDPVRAEPKNKDSFTSDLICKFMFLSNVKPDVSSELSEKRRLIFCELGPIKTAPDPDYLEKLWDEAPRFLGTCKGNYLRYCKGHTVVPVDSDVTKALIHENNEKWDRIFSRRFVLERSKSIRLGDFHAAAQAVGIKNDMEYRDFKEYIKSKDGVKEKIRHPRMMLGVRMKRKDDFVKEEQEDAKMNVEREAGLNQ